MLKIEGCPKNCLCQHLTWAGANLLCLEQFSLFCFSERTPKNLLCRHDLRLKFVRFLWFLFQGRQIVYFLRNLVFCKRRSFLFFSHFFLAFLRYIPCNSKSCGRDCTWIESKSYSGNGLLTSKKVHLPLKWSVKLIIAIETAFCWQIHLYNLVTVITITFLFYHSIIDFAWTNKTDTIFEEQRYFPQITAKFWSGNILTYKEKESYTSTNPNASIRSCLHLY